ncbi:hypothetical protein B0T13DRAFT_457381 [Neurospora crassa]|nr:hypothetical protein B0T13DRAFT_457381 [Neurospora crassa]
MNTICWWSKSLSLFPLPRTWPSSTLLISVLSFSCAPSDQAVAPAPASLSHPDPAGFDYTRYFINLTHPLVPNVQWARKMNNNGLILARYQLPTPYSLTPTGGQWTLVPDEIQPLCWVRVV